MLHVYYFEPFLYHVAHPRVRLCSRLGGREAVPQKMGSDRKESKSKLAVSVAPGVSRYTLEKVKPHLREELSRRIMQIAEISADRMGSNREAMIEATLKRFADWITPSANHVPRGLLSRLWRRIKSSFSGVRTAKSRPEPPKPPKESAEASKEERWQQVMLDQGFMFISALNQLEAVDGGAIAMIWWGPCRAEEGRLLEEHQRRNGKVYAVRDCWAIERGLMKPGAEGYYDEVTPVGYDPGCVCRAQWLYDLDRLPPDMLTIKGDAALKRMRAEFGDSKKEI